MSHEQLSAALTDLEVGQDPASTFLTDRHRAAVAALSRSFSSRRPIAILIGEGRLAAKFVIRGFLSGLPGDVAVARIEEPCDNATDFMGKVIDSVGFQPKDMDLEDLEGIFTMFLSFQKSHHRRTVLCIERTQDHDLWVLDKIQSLVAQEGEGQFGLTILVSGGTKLKELLHSGPLSDVSEVAGKRTTLPPFTMAETKQYIRQRLETAGKSGIDQLFQYQAITRIYELSLGIADDVAALVNRCLEATAAEGVSLVTAELVQRTHDNCKGSQQECDYNADTVNMQGFRPRCGRLVYQISGEDVHELTLRQGHTLIGRSKLCDVRIESSTVSRRHALISYSPEGTVLVDLNSTNGTFVDGCQVRRHELQPGETIDVGGTAIEYNLEQALEQDQDDTMSLPLPGRELSGKTTR